MKATLFIFFLCIFYSFGLAKEITGRVMIGHMPANEAEVKFFEKDDTKVIFKVKTDRDGYFNVNLPDGKYFFQADYTFKRINYRGYSGKNPVLIPEEDYVGIKLLKVYPIKTKNLSNKKTKIKGKVIFNNKPLQGAVVYFYLNPTDIKGMPYVYSLPTNKRGQFLINDILPGTYYVVARKKNTGELFGPISEGDYIGFLQYIPFNFVEGRIYEITIPVFMKEKDDITTLVKGEYKIKGKIVDEHGNPLAGLYAFAYKNKEMGHERPVSISKKTDKDGYFEINLPQKGRYYIGAREFYGGTPVQGEWYGVYEGTFDHHLDVEQEVVEISITAKKILW